MPRIRKGRSNFCVHSERSRSKCLTHLQKRLADSNCCRVRPSFQPQSSTPLLRLLFVNYPTESGQQSLIAARSFAIQSTVVLCSHRLPVLRLLSVRRIPPYCLLKK